MLVTYSPQRSDSQLEYQFEGEVITATLDGEMDIFDFSSMPEGEVARKEDGTIDIETTLPILPIVDAKRIEGELQVTLLKFHGQNASEAERFPQPEVV